MGTEQFRDDDQGYLSWVASHAHGYVINIQRSLNPADARTHHASCHQRAAAAWADVDRALRQDLLNVTSTGPGL